MSRPLSFRFRILALVLGVAIVPLVLSGVVLLRGASRSGEQLLSQRLERAATESRKALIGRWIPLRSMLLDVSEWPEVTQAFEGGSCDPLAERLAETDSRVRQVTLRAASTIVCSFDRSTLTPDQGGIPPTTTPLMRMTASLFGVQPAGAMIEFGVQGELVLPPEILPPSTAGMVLTLLDPVSGASLLPVPLDAHVLTKNRFTWGGEEWIASSQSFDDPPVELVVAAPQTPSLPRPSYRTVYFPDG